MLIIVNSQSHSVFFSSFLLFLSLVFLLFSCETVFILSNIKPAATGCVSARLACQANYETGIERYLNLLFLLFSQLIGS